LCGRLYDLDREIFMKNPIVAIQGIYQETMSEMKKCSWPTRQELYESTVIVVICLIILSIFVTFSDKLIELGIRAITGI